MSKRTKIILAVAAVLVVGLLAGSYIISRMGEEAAPTVTLTIEPTKAEEPTEPPVAEATVTEAPTATPEPTDEPAVEPSMVPTATEAPTETPTVTVAPSPTPTATPTPTETPTPEPTATPTPMPSEQVADMEPVLRVQMGDDVYYEFYENGILLVTGTGATWDFEAELYEYKKNSGSYVMLCNDDRLNNVNSPVSAKVIVIEEGITRIGDWALSCETLVKTVYFPTTLKSIGYAAFYNLGDNDKYSDADVSLIGLDTSKVEIGEQVFYRSKVTAEEYATYLATPTPTPLPTPTPTPDPENPRLLYTQKMGDNVTYEKYDNDTMYIRGSGKVWDVSWDYVDIALGAKKIVVEEGITYLGTCSLFIRFEELVLPSTLERVDGDGLGLGSAKPGFTVTGYKNGIKTTVIATEEYAAPNGIVYLPELLYKEFGITSKHWPQDY